jgi:hypothetical protein
MTDAQVEMIINVLFQKQADKTEDSGHFHGSNTSAMRARNKRKAMAKANGAAKS